jgi:hypothetical protein
MNEINIEDMEDVEEIVLDRDMLEEILKLDSCRRYISVKESDLYIPYGFKAVGFDFKVVSSDLTPDIITTEDTKAGKENLEKHTHSPFIIYSNSDPLLTDAEAYELLSLCRAKHLFMMDSCGGIVRTVEVTDFLKRIKTATIVAVRSTRLNEIESKRDRF